MASDAHAHPADLASIFPLAEEERRRFTVSCAACAWNREDFERHEALARKAGEDGAAPLALCFAVHPQLPAYLAGDGNGVADGAASGDSVGRSLETLAILAGEGRLHAIGETGFDLYGGTFRETEKIQDELFAVHLETALEKGLPLVLHVRRALHKVFAHTKALKRLPAVVFHAYSGALGDGEALLRRGINAYFSFGAAVTLNHKLAMEACARLPLERLLTETDAPYQPPRGAAYSRWADLPLTLKAIMKLRPAPLEAPLKAVEDLERRIDENWRRVFLNLDG